MDNPKSVALVGYSNINLKFAKESQADEVWTMNHHLFLQERMEDDKRDLFRCDRLFELHQPAWFTRKEIPDAVAYLEWLKDKKPFPIYMLEPFDYIPSSVAFPREILKKELFSHLWRGGQNEIEYYTSSVALMMAFAIHLNVQRIELYGIECLTDTEYADQKPCVEFMLGMAMGRGIDVVFHPTCSLCNAQVYGYEGVPHLVRARMHELLDHYRKLMDEAHVKAEQSTADFNAGKLTDKDAAMEAIDIRAIYSGAVGVLQTLLTEHDEYISAQFLEERHTTYKNVENEWTGKTNMAKAEAEMLIKQKKKNQAEKAWRTYQDARAHAHAFSGACQVLKKLRDECRLGKPDHHLVKLIVE